MRQRDADHARIPMTVLGGYLGSGKTTLLNSILTGSPGLRVAVVVNDFGAVNVDAQLLRGGSSGTIELANGCVCCSLADGMAPVMEQLRHLEPPPEHVLVEVSGVGDPAAVAAWADHPGFRRQAIVVCVDAETARSRAADRWVGDTLLRQVRGADVLLLTKTDLVDDDRRRAVRTWLADVAPGVPVVRERTSVLELLGDPPVSPRAGVAAGDAAHHPHAEHASWTASVDGPVDLDRLARFLDALPSTVVRGKGVLRTVQRPDRRTVVQLVGRRRDVYDDGAWRTAPSTFVLIATGSPGDSPAMGDDLTAALGVGTGSASATADDGSTDA